MKRFLLTLTILTQIGMASSIYAKDFGIQGHVFPIVEQNILEYIEEKLREVNLEEFNNKFQEQVKKSVNRPKSVTGIVKAETPNTHYHDPSYVLEDDIFDHEGKLMHARGTKVNPLEHMPLREVLIFVDGDDEAQVEYALNERRSRGGFAKIILTNGAPLELSNEHKVWFFFDQAGIFTKKFEITQVPSLVEQDGLRLKVSTMVIEDKR